MKTVIVSPKNFLGSLSKVGTTSLFMGKHCKPSVRQDGQTRGREGQNPGVTAPVPSSASTSCESAVRGLDRRTTPSSLSTKPSAQEVAVVPPEIPGLRT